MLGRYHPPIDNSSESKSDAQAKGSLNNNHSSALAEQQKMLFRHLAISPIGSLELLPQIFLPIILTQ